MRLDVWGEEASEGEGGGLGCEEEDISVPEIFTHP